MIRLHLHTSKTHDQVPLDPDLLLLAEVKPQNIIQQIYQLQFERDFRRRLGREWDDAFKEQEHPRAKSGKHAGEFAKKGLATGTTSKPTTTSKPVTLTKTNNRAWSGQPKPNATRLSKQEAGKIGEQVAQAFVRTLGGGREDARPLNEQRANFPVDMIGDHELYEVKTGQVSNSQAASQWRATIGQPGKKEAAWLKQASPLQKAKHNARKNAKIMERKQQVVDEYSKIVGRAVKAKTITLILDPDTGTADVHMFDGFHRRIAYNSDHARSGYVGSYKYKA